MEILVSIKRRRLEMAEITFHNEIKDVIDVKEDVLKKFERLVETSNKEIQFSKNEDGSLAGHIQYRNYNINIRMNVSEVFGYVMKCGTKVSVSDVITMILRDKVCEELLNEKIL